MIKERREEWENNHDALIIAYKEMLKENMDKGIYKRPSVSALSKRTGISRTAIYDHLKEMTLVDSSLMQKLRADDVLEALAKKAIDGDVLAIKLYAQVVMNWSEKNIQQVEVKETPTLKVSFVDNKEDEKIEETPEEKA